MSRQSSFALGVGATVVGGIALVLAIRALIPAAEPEPQRPAAGAVERPRSDAAEDAASAASASPSIDAPDAQAPIAQPEASAIYIAQPEPPRAEPEESDASGASGAAPSFVSFDGGFPPAAPGPIVPVEVLRADLDRVRARYEAAAASGDGGGARTPEARRAMIALMEGGALLRRLSAGDPAFHDQLNAYRSALSSGGALDDNARAALRARMFDSAHGDRAALYDEILRALR